MTDKLIPQHVRLAMGEDIDTGSIENPFKQIPACDGTKRELSDAQRTKAVNHTKGMMPAHANPKH